MISLIFVALIGHALGNAEGPPTCDLSPDHGDNFADPAAASGFAITLTPAKPCYYPGESLKIAIDRADGIPMSLMGFMIKDTSGNGQFSVIDAGTSLTPFCTPENTAVSHVGATFGPNDRLTPIGGNYLVGAANGQIGATVVETMNEWHLLAEKTVPIC